MKKKCRRNLDNFDGGSEDDISNVGWLKKDPEACSL